MFEKLIIKFISQTADLNELERLVKYLEKKENAEIFKSYVKTNYYTIYAMHDFDRRDILETVQKRISKERKIKFFEKKHLSFMRYAAIILIFFSLGYYFNTFRNQPKLEYIIPNEDDIVLTTSDGRDIILDEEKDEISIESKINLNKNSNQLNYKKTFKVVNDVNKPIFHTLKIPYGKRYKIVLSDGTLVHLNSGSTIKYPIVFDRKNPRKIFLSGEAFFDVVENKNQIFTVNSESVNVEVYGTKFNFKNYPEDNSSDIVLVEGSIGLYSKYNRNITRLKPGVKGSFNKSDYSITQDQINTSIYTSWIDGQIVFRNENFESILTKLERLYNVEIINNSKNNKPNETFNAKIDVEKESINEVLGYFKKIYNIEYEIYNNKIIIN